jgi:phage terminase large subunit-like protein
MPRKSALDESSAFDLPFNSDQPRLGKHQPIPGAAGAHGSPQTWTDSLLADYMLDIEPSPLGVTEGYPPRGRGVIKWIEDHCRVPEGRLVGRPVRLRKWQRDVICGIYDSPTRNAIVSFGRKNGKSALAAFLLLVHLCGHKAQPNSGLVSDAQSKKQAAVLFKLAAKCARLSPTLSSRIKIRDAVKELLCPELGTLYQALSSEVRTSFGLSPVFAVHDELGQVRGPTSDLYDSIETAMGAYDNPLSITISTQAPTDGDLLSVLIDDAATGKDKTIKLFLFSAAPGLDPFSEEAIREANPAYGDFLNAKEVQKLAEDARRMPSRESTFRNLILNQRVDATSPFVSQNVWMENGAMPDKIGTKPVYGGLDLATVNDLCSLILETEDGDIHCAFWLPAEGIKEKSRADRVPYDVWAAKGFLYLVPGRSVEYEFVAEYLRGVFDNCDVKAIAFDRYNMKFLMPWLKKAGFTDKEMEKFIEFGQGYASMSPAIRALESRLLNKKAKHGMHPVLTMCAKNATIEKDPAGNRKFTKAKSTGRIDGMVALAMSEGVMPIHAGQPVKKYQLLVI